VRYGSIPVRSGRTDRHRLSRGGDRQANAALHHIVKNRMSNDPSTRAYRDSHLAKGWTNKAVYRALKRAVAREVYRALSGHCAVPDYTDLRPARRAKNITLTTVAEHLHGGPHASASSSSAATINSPTATANGSRPLDNA